MKPQAVDSRKWVPHFRSSSDTVCTSLMITLIVFGCVYITEDIGVKHLKG